MKNILINGMGTLGREIFRQLYRDYPGSVAAINDPNATVENLAYLLNYESSGRGFLQPYMTSVTGGKYAESGNDGKFDFISVGGSRVTLFHESDITSSSHIHDLSVWIVIDCTGATTTMTDAQKYIDAGARSVIVCNPLNDPSLTIVYGVNESNISTHSLNIISAGTSDLQAIAVILNIINNQNPINAGSIRSITAYAASQQITDGYSNNKFERGRSAAANIVPTGTYTHRVIGGVIPELNGRLLGDEFRVPILQGGAFNLALTLTNSTDRSTISQYIKDASNTLGDLGLLCYTDSPIVSSDVVNSETLVTVSSKYINVGGLGGYDGSLVDITGLYDNVVGFAAQIIRLANVAYNNVP